MQNSLASQINTQSPPSQDDRDLILSLFAPLLDSTLYKMAPPQDNAASRVNRLRVMTM
jgi:hypothetical protein